MTDAAPPRVAVITGGGSGLGRATARLLAAQGAAVAVLDVDSAAAGMVAEELRAAGADALGLACDVSDQASVADAARAVLAQFGHCDVLVNNAGVLLRGPLESHSVEAWDRVMSVNLRGCFLCSQTFGRVMLATGRGSIVSVASTAAESPTPAAAAYCASKAGILALTRQMALEWGPRGVRANAISPGFMRTGMTRQTYEHPELERQRAELVPLRRISRLDEVASVIAFLASDAASYVNGVNVLVDGGFMQTVSLNVPRVIQYAN